MKVDPDNQLNVLTFCSICINYINLEGLQFETISDPFNAEHMFKSTKVFYLKSTWIIFFSLQFSVYSFAQEPLAVDPTADPNEICSGAVSQLHAMAYGGSGSYTFNWTSNPPGFSSNMPSPVVNPNVTTTYTVIVNDGYDEVSGSTTITVFNIVSEAGTNQTICHGSNTTLFGIASGGSGEYTYSWQPADKLIDPFVQQPTTVHLYVSTLFTLTITDNALGCDNSDAVNVIIFGSFLNTNPVASANEICHGESTQLFAVADGGCGDYSYSWTSNPPGFTSTLSDPTVTPEYTTTYTVEIFDNYNFAQGSVIVTVSERPVSDAGSDRSISPGNSTILYGNASSGSGNYLFHWEPADKLINPDVAQPLTVPLYESILFSLEITDAQTGCEADPADFVLVTVSESGLGANPGAQPEIICNGASSQLYSNAHGGSGNYTYSWASSPPGFESYLPAPVVFPSENTTYNILVSDGSDNVFGSLYVNIANFNFIDEICMVNVDSLSGKNIVLWEKTPDEAISSYNIYRESNSGGSFDLIGNVDHDNLSAFTDYASNPLQRSFSYGITTLDTCNNETSMSMVHTTMHLNINTGINAYNLIWTPYSGFNYQTYFIYRRQLPDGFQLIDAVPNSITSYSDINPPEGILDYVIEIRNENGCNPNKEDKSYISVFSNIISTNVGLEDLENHHGFISVYPNPNHGKFTVQINSDVECVSVINMTGNNLDSFSKDDIAPCIFYPDLTNYGPGTYLIKAILKNGLTVTQNVTVY
jgi:hypothetical protein